MSIRPTIEDVRRARERWDRHNSRRPFDLGRLDFLAVEDLRGLIKEMHAQTTRLHADLEAAAGPRSCAESAWGSGWRGR